jgi:hypothetical protein
MSESNAEGRQGGAVNPQGLRLEDLARILSASGLRPVTVETLRADIEDGAPVNPDGTMNLVQYTTWMVRELTSGGD